MAGSPEHIALRVFLLLLSIGLIVVSSIFIFIKRQVSRRKSRLSKHFYAPIGTSAPKNVKEDLNNKVNSTIKVKYEPIVLTHEYVNNRSLYLNDSKYSFYYRMKAVDEFKTLQNEILRVNALLEIPPLVNIRDFLTASRERVLKGASRSLIDRYCKLYTWAREDPEVFSEKQYDDFKALQQELLDCVARGSAMTSREAPSDVLPVIRSRRTSIDSDDSQTALIEIGEGKPGQSHTVKFVKKDKGMENEAIFPLS